MTEKVNPDNHKKIIGILSAIQLFPEEPITEYSTNSWYKKIQNKQISTEIKSKEKSLIALNYKGFKLYLELASLDYRLLLSNTESNSS